MSVENARLRRQLTEAAAGLVRQQGDGVHEACAHGMKLALGSLSAQKKLVGKGGGPGNTSGASNIDKDDSEYDSVNLDKGDRSRRLADMDSQEDLNSRRTIINAQGDTRIGNERCESSEGAELAARGAASRSPLAELAELRALQSVHLDFQKADLEFARQVAAVACSTNNIKKKGNNITSNGSNNERASRDEEEFQKENEDNRKDSNSSNSSGSSRSSVSSSSSAFSSSSSSSGFTSGSSSSGGRRRFLEKTAQSADHHAKGKGVPQANNNDLTIKSSFDTKESSEKNSKESFMVSHPGAQPAAAGPATENQNTMMLRQPAATSIKNGGNISTLLTSHTSITGPSSSSVNKVVVASLKKKPGHRKASVMFS